MKYRILMIALLAAAFAGPLAAAELSPPSIKERGKALDAEFRAAVAQKEAGSTGVEEVFAKIATRYEILASEDYDYWYNAGISRWWARQGHLSILDYRRALNHDYLNPEIWDNLAQARLLAGTTAPGGEGFLTCPWGLWLLYVAIVTGTVALLSFAAWLWSRRKGFTKVALIAVSLTVLFGLTSISAAQWHPVVWVFRVDTQGHKGDAEIYANLPEALWKAGQECWVKETRDNWVRIKVGETFSWVPSAALWRP